MEFVAPPVGAWIEIQMKKAINDIKNVAPPVGAWIEMTELHPVQTR